MGHNQQAWESTLIPSSRDAGEACDRFLDELGHWIQACLRRYGDAPPTHVHDQGTYTTSWEPWVKARDTGPVRRFLGTVRDKVAANFHRTGLWRHGYWRMRDVHHGTEHFELFLGALWRLDRNDDATAGHLIHATEHLGNWSDDVPAWFDWETGLFHATFFGADGVRQTDDLAVNVPDHLRCVNLCLLAHDVAADPRYLRLAVRHGDVWARAIVADARLPVAVCRAGPLYELPEPASPAAGAAAAIAVSRGQLMRMPRLMTPAAYAHRVQKFFERRRRAAAIEPMPGPPDVGNAERFLASNGVVTFLRLWRLTGQPHFRDAAERLIDPLVTQIGDPDAGAVAHVVRAYRTITGDDRYDSRVLAAVDGLAPWSFADLSVDPSSPRYTRQPGGVGKRKDMLRWFEDGRPRRHSPMLLALAAEMRADRDLATRALDLARAQFRLARRLFPDGRDHGCAARSVSAIARGHGRDNDTGAVTGVLAPMLEFIHR
jgi:hypothetical protein